MRDTAAVRRDSDLRAPSRQRSELSLDGKGIVVVVVHGPRGTDKNLRSAKMKNRLAESDAQPLLRVCVEEDASQG